MRCTPLVLVVMEAAERNKGTNSDDGSTQLKIPISSRPDDLTAAAAPSHSTLHDGRFQEPATAAPAPERAHHRYSRDGQIFSRRARRHRVFHGSVRRVKSCQG